MTPSVSIALCTYNGAQFLDEQLQSIAQQTLLPAELVVCDDGSTDKTLSIIETFARSVEFPVRLQRNESNLGSTRNFEQAVSLCRGQYIALCDQDDCWNPNKLATLAAALRGGEVGGVFSNGLLMNEDSRLTGGSLWQAHQLGDLTKVFGEGFDRRAAVSELAKNDVATGATLMFRSALRSQLCPFPSAWFHDGWIAWMLVLHSSLRAITEPLIRYRVHSIQQVGVPDYSLAGKLHKSVGKPDQRKALYGGHLRKFEALLAHVNQQACEVWLQQTIADKCRHLRHRAELPQKGLRRWKTILDQGAAYRQFSRGWKSMLLDALG